MEQTYYFKNKPYRIVAESKIKANGVLKHLCVDDVTVIHSNYDWIPVVIYECLYDNPDGKIWVRAKEQFFKLFKTQPDDNSKGNS